MEDEAMSCWLTIEQPNGEYFDCDVLEREDNGYQLPWDRRLVIGRQRSEGEGGTQADIQLPQDKWVSRLHFCIESCESRFWVKRIPDSTHSVWVKPFHQAGNDDVLLVENEPGGYSLRDQDTILIRGSYLIEPEQRNQNCYWQFTFYDSEATLALGTILSSRVYLYNLNSQRLSTQSQQREIVLGKGNGNQRQRLIHYLAQKTFKSAMLEGDSKNDDFADVGSREELIKYLSLDKDNDTHPNTLLSNIVFQIHQAIKQQYGQESQKLIESVNLGGTRGYRLVNCDVIEL
jgi:hypothetical protein